jgi:hypothetical protein
LLRQNYHENTHVRSNQSIMVAVPELFDREMVDMDMI